MPLMIPPLHRSSMYVTCVHVHLKSERIGEFPQTSILNQEESIQKPGNQRFDISAGYKLFK